MNVRRYKYRREDFGEMPVKLDHLTIYLNFLEDRVEVDNHLEMTAKESLDKMSLDAKHLRILEVQWSMRLELNEAPGGHTMPNRFGDSASRPSGPADAADAERLIPLEFDYQEQISRLFVQFPRKVEIGEKFCVRTLTQCFSSDHILEGIYKDSTPPGAPQQYMSQCQQWGFQRIMPILDDCRAKCTMRTTIEADAAYTHLISNGNIDHSLNPGGKPVRKAGDPSRQIITFDNPIPMAPYLFLVCAGTWDELADEIAYDSGRKVRLEYLVPPGRAEGARIPMQILKQAIPWIARTQDYEYKGDTYRTICMNKSNFGGMENMGNTTIVTDAALVDEHTVDTSLLYAHAVVVHEFEHNQCGSETTMETPFDVWLNEAFTVDVERQFMADVFDADFVRLLQVDSIRNPLLGPLAIEDAGHAGRIVREGFNDPDELIDGVTYVKAAEVIRMLRLILGTQKFKAGKDLYFSRYRYGNANTDQFFECFEEVSGSSLELFRKRWLYTIGYPKVSAAGAYEADAKRYVIRFSQKVEPGQSPFHIPVQLALVDGQGRDIEGTSLVFELKEPEAELVLENIESPPAFPSLNRDYSFYGTFRFDGATREALTLQTRLDPNLFNRVDAMRQLTDGLRVKLLHDPGAGIDSQWLTLYGKILGEAGLPAALKAYLLRIEEQPMDRAYSTWFRELVDAREKLMQAVNSNYRNQLVDHFKALNTYRPSKGLSPKEGIEDRMLKNTLLDLIAIDDSPESHHLIKDHFENATHATDRLAALAALNRGSSPDRLDLLEEVYRKWHSHLSGYANYLRVVSSGTREDVFDMIEKERRRPTFDITQPTWCRALFLPMATNNKMLWTDRGIEWITGAIIDLAPINTTTASRMMNAFQHVHGLKPNLRQKVESALDRILQEVSEDVSPTIHGQGSAYRSGT